MNIEKEGLDEYFSVSRLDGGEEKVYELIPNGKTIKLTELNKEQYLELR